MENFNPLPLPPDSTPPTEPTPQRVPIQPIQVIPTTPEPKENRFKPALAAAGRFVRTGLSTLRTLLGKSATESVSFLQSVPGKITLAAVIGALVGGGFVHLMYVKISTPKAGSAAFTYRNTRSKPASAKHTSPAHSNFKTQKQTTDKKKPAKTTQHKPWLGR